MTHSTDVLQQEIPGGETASFRPVVDRYGRRLRYLRISVTDLCNLSCTYCNPVKGCAATHPHKLSWEELEFLVDVGVNDLGIEAIRITGGEPTIRPGLVNWVRRIARHGLHDIAMTTNGILLGRMARPLREAGLKRVNVSLDTFDGEKYRDVTRGGSLERCLEGIEVARQVLDRVKVNAVLLRGFNDHEIPDFLEFSQRTGIEVRFIELMPIFGQKDYFHRHFISVEEIKERLADQGIHLETEDGGNRTGYGPATTYRVVGSRARIGFISQMSDTKCLSCNKLRMTSDGALKPCLLSPKEIKLAPAIAERDRDTVAEALRHQFLIRAERYDALEALNDPFQRSMQAIGG
ncbi:MAG: GTP 3',8-cyclase MoaA [Candidatus Sumerlaeia bacterium]|nr:GTP 3',8-cyclase MoaA [Candidatus Sumerlaeia bacterium]